MRLRQASAFAGVACLLGVFAGGCATSERSAEANSPHPHGSPATSEAIASATKLASIQLGRDVSASDPLVKSIEQFTAMLVRRCREDVIHIDGIADFMSSDLREHSITETPLAALKRLNRIVPSEVRSFDCTGTAAAYLVLREPK